MIVAAHSALICQRAISLSNPHHKFTGLRPDRRGMGGGVQRTSFASVAALFDARPLSARARCARRRAAGVLCNRMPRWRLPDAALALKACPPHGDVHISQVRKPRLGARNGTQSTANRECAYVSGLERGQGVKRCKTAGKPPKTTLGRRHEPRGAERRVLHVLTQKCLQNPHSANVRHSDADVPH